MNANYDVVVIGGAFAGASLGLLMRRWVPGSRVLIVERQPAFSRKVGEATVELSAIFLHKVLGMYDVLSRDHLPKHGLRFWYSDGPERRLHEMAEVGPDELPLLPAFQLDRAQLDETLLGTAEAEGCEVARPEKVTAFEPGWPLSTVRIQGHAERTVTARWVIDASGRRAFIAKQMGVHERVDAHPTAAMWARWTGVADLDGPGLCGSHRAARLPPIKTSRRLATNHFCGYGYWCWAIPLASGETSIGVVYNRELYTPPGEGTPRDRYERMVKTHPGLRELLADAALVDGDFLSYDHLPYRATRYADRGWALVGDAASFLDPYYSPGLDHVATSVYATARILEDDLSGKLDESVLQARIEEHNRQFALSYDRWLEALYLGKYELMGDAELAGGAAFIDTAMYYLGVVGFADREIDALATPVFARPTADVAFKVMTTIKERMLRLARERRASNTYGRRNTNWRMLIKSPGLGKRRRRDAPHGHAHVARRRSAPGKAPPLRPGPRARPPESVTPNKHRRTKRA